jgi:hypothetical protein
MEVGGEGGGHGYMKPPEAEGGCDWLVLVNWEWIWFLEDLGGEGVCLLLGKGRRSGVLLR